jgi:hypothetical protein
MPLFRPVVLLIALGLCLGGPAATASENRAPASRGNRAPLILLEHLQGFLTSVWAKTGCPIDPWGRCSQGSQQQERTTLGQAPVPADEGCRLDPLGCALSR